MQMRSGCPAGAADVANRFSLFDADAFAYSLGKSAQMSIGRSVLACMLENDDVAITPLRAGKLDRRIGCGAYLGAARGSIIDAVVGAPFLQDWVEATAEARCDARKL